MDDQDTEEAPDAVSDLSDRDAFRIHALTNLPDPAMRSIVTRIRLLAADRVPVLISGESGVGKEIVARALHHLSPRARAPWTAINCGAIPAGLIETELFGHERGAFSGATSHKVGLLEASDGGTVLLDEIGELPLELQSKLLRFLDDHEIRRVGATSTRPVNVRIVAATNRDLVTEVREGRFRQDLFYRLNVASMTVPPLRERMVDIPVLAQLLLDRARTERHLACVPLTIEALGALVTNPWPGNVRELKHAMELLAITITGTEATFELLPDSLKTSPEAIPDEPSSPRTLRKRTVRAARSAERPRPVIPVAQELAQIEKTRMLQALAASGWVQLRAARLIQMPRRTFVTKMKLYGIRRK